MEQLIDRLHYYENHPQEPVDPEWVDAMAEAYPYYTEPAIMLMSRDTSGIPLERLQAIGFRLRLNCPNPQTLLEQISPEAASMAGIYPSTTPAPTANTDEAIDRFIATYGHQSAEEDALLERLIFNPTPDYAQTLEQQEANSLPNPGEAAPGSQDDLINAFILKNTPPQAPEAPTAEVAEPQPQPADTQPVEPELAATSEPKNKPKSQAPADLPAEASLTEGLARVYIQQRRYDRAFEILQAISLNNPEKSIYFADQLRFLQKLIINQRHIDKRTTQNNPQ
ncbi:MAG: hypothetical protein K2L93_02435 [Muribaculaceae bacterium]|nr:hypothetical protein [Muribaculaceae bacterium]MDE6321132.1 hypothetical protein [Muribaculaceae bacterium]